MANDFSSNPVVIDTAFSSVPTDWNGMVCVEHFEFIEYALDADAVIVKNGAGTKTVWSANGASDLTPVESRHIGWFHGFTVPTLTAGKLLAFLTFKK